MKMGRYAIGPPQGSTHAIAHVLQPTLWGENQKSRCQSLAMPNGWCRMHGDLRPALRRGIRSSARHGRRCGAACPVLALLRRADPAKWPLCARSIHSTRCNSEPGKHRPVEGPSFSSSAVLHSTFRSTFCPATIGPWPSILPSEEKVSGACVVVPGRTKWP